MTSPIQPKPVILDDFRKVRDDIAHTIVALLETYGN